MALQGELSAGVRVFSDLKALDVNSISPRPPDTSNPLLYKFSDALITPDPFYSEDYAAQHKGRKTTIVIDNGEPGSCASLLWHFLLLCIFTVRRHLGVPSSSFNSLW